MRRLDRLPTNRWIYSTNDPYETEEEALMRWQRNGLPTVARTEAARRSLRLRRRREARQVILLLLALLPVLLGWLYVSTDQYHDEQRERRLKR